MASSAKDIDLPKPLRTIVLWSAIAVLFGMPSLSAQEKKSQPEPSKQETPAPAPTDLPATLDGLPGEGPLRQYPWFRNLWNSRRLEWSQKLTQDQGSLVLFGDSITQGWPSVETYFPGVKIANRGISGDTTRGMLIRLPEDVLALNPKGLVLLMGTNDLEEGAEPAMIASNVKAILQSVKKANPSMPVVLCLIFPSSESKKRPTEKIQATNKLLLQLVKGDSQVTVVDTFTLFADPQGNAIPELFPDLLHLNKNGYDRWAAALRPILATLEFLELEDDTFVVEPGFKSLFNGKDLTGWGFRPTAAPKKPNTNPDAPAVPVVEQALSFDGKTVSPDGRYVAKHGRLIVTTPSEGRRIQQLWTIEEFPSNFTMKLEFRATPNADSGVFIRKPQLQCRDYPLAGPYKDLKNYKPQDWNELVVIVRDNKAHCTCNGEILESALELPATGPIGLEGDRGQMEYRRIRIKLEP